MSHQNGKTLGQRVDWQTSVGRREFRRRRFFHAPREWLGIGLACGWVLSSCTLIAATPAVPACSSNLTVECSGSNGMVVTFSTGTGSPASRCEPPSGSVFLPGATVVRCTAWDSYGQTNTCKFVVTVVDTQAPLLECPPDTLAAAEAGESFVTNVELARPVVSDNHAVTRVTNDAHALYGAGRDWWWVDPAGGDDADALRGDYRRAFRTLGAALARVQDGDTVIMMPGTNFIRCAFLGDERPELLVTRSNLSIFGQPGATLVATNLGDGVLCAGAANLKIKGLTLVGFRTNDNAVPFRLWAGIHIMGGCEGAEIAGNRLDNWMDQGIAVLNGDPSTSTNVWVHDNYITRCGFVWRTTNGFPLDRFDGAAIVPDAGWLVESNRIEDCAYTIEVYPPDNLGFRGQPCVVRHNTIKNNLIGIYGGNNRCPVIITGNTVVNATNYSWVVDANFNPWIGFLGNLGGWFPGGVVLQGNHDGPAITSNTIAGWRLGIWALHGALTNAVIAGNHISETWQAGILLGDDSGPALSRNLVISGNILTNAGSRWPGYGAIAVYFVADTEFAGNSISGKCSDGVGVYCSSSVVSSNVTIKDTWLDGVFDWGVVIGDGTQAAEVSNTTADSATFRCGKYYTNLPAVVVAEGQPVALPPTPPARADLDRPWSLAAWEEEMGSDAPLHFPLGTNIVLWTAADASGNTATCAQQIIVFESGMAPESCPDDLTVAAQSNCEAAVIYPLPEVAANSVVICHPAPGSVLPVGSTTVNCWITDGSGRSNQCAFQITVDDAAPVLSLHREAGLDSFILTWPQTCLAWVLETSSSCADQASWSPHTAPPATEHGVHRVILPVESDQRYFRLRRP